MLHSLSKPLHAALVAGLAAVLPVQDALAVEVNVRILQFEQIDDPDPRPGLDTIDGPDNRGAGDYYPRVRIGANSFERRRSTFAEAATVVAIDSRPDWTFTEDVPGGAIVPITLQMWDADTIENNDDIIDINPQDDVQEVVALLDLQACEWSVEGETENFISRVEGDGDTEHFGVLEGGDRGRLFFQINCDVDGDGIPDNLERFGIRGEGGGMLLDLPELGADPCRENVVAQIGFMSAAGHTHRPTDAALQMVVDGFNAADRPAKTGDDCPYAGFPKEDSGVGLIVVPDTAGQPEAATMTLEDLAAFAEASIAREVRPYVHFAFFGHGLAPSTGFAGRTGLCCANVKDFIVSLGGLSGSDSNGNPQNGTDLDQAGTFMHELGHTLGLAHSGESGIDRDQNDDPDSQNCKPNYLSVMNYWFQTNGLVNDDTGDQLMLFSSRALPSLDEGDLDDPDGIDDGPFQTAWCGSTGGPVPAAAGGRGDGAIDWDGSGSDTDLGVTQDIAATNTSGGSCCRRSDGLAASPGQVLNGHDDWAAIRFRAGMAAGGGAESQIFDEQMTTEDVEAMRDYWQGRLRCSPPESGTWVISADCRIWRDAVSPGDLVVTNGAELTVTSEVHLDIDLTRHALRVEPGARLTIVAGGRID